MELILLYCYIAGILKWGFSNSFFHILMGMEVMMMSLGSMILINIVPYQGYPPLMSFGALWVVEGVMGIICLLGVFKTPSFRMLGSWGVTLN